MDVKLLLEYQVQVDLVVVAALQVTVVPVVIETNMLLNLLN